MAIPELISKQFNAMCAALIARFADPNSEHQLVLVESMDADNKPAYLVSIISEEGDTINIYPVAVIKPITQMIDEYQSPVVNEEDKTND